MLRQLDYIVIRFKWRNVIKDTRPHSTLNSVGSDHQVVSIEGENEIEGSKSSLNILHDWRAFSVRRHDLEPEG